MPRVKLDYVVSFSSEDSENPASNLLAYEVSKKKWLCKAGEASCSVVLQLNHAVQISTVHIGAYHAALVEVLVGRSETPNNQFEVLVPSSVFLSPMDSRRGTGVERVRSFSAEQLAPAKAQKWDRVRIVCSQPYNKHCKYGLSFVHIFESDKSESDKPSSPQLVPAPAVPTRVAVPVGQYSSDEDDFRPGELFAKHRLSEGSKNTEAQIRQASSQALRNINDTATKLVKTPIAKTNTSRTNQTNDFSTSRQKDNLMYTDDDEQPHAKIDSVVKRHKDEKEQETKKKEAVQNLFRKDKERTNRLEQASKNFKEFLDDKEDKKNSSSSRSKDNSKENDRRNKELNNSTSKDSSRHEDRRNKDLSNSRSRDSSKDNKGNTDSLNNTRNKDSSRDNERRNRDDGNSSQSRTKDAGASGDNRKRQHSDDRQKGKDVVRPGPVSSTPHTLLAGVVFALSGYENPRRARLRDAAAAMGARFQRDWSPACTHLICAFPNTPKLRTVRSSPSGSNCIVVLGEWIEQCCEKKRLLPWQWFATEPKKKVQPPAGWDDDDKTASEYDTDDEIEKVLRKQKKQRTDKSPSPQPTTSRDSPQPHSSRDLAPRPQTSREKSPTPHSSRDLSPRPQTSREKSPTPHSSREKSPKPHTSREKSPKQSSRKENQQKRTKERSHSKESPKQKRNLNFSNMSSDSDVAFVKDERIQANITIDSGDSTDEEKPVVKEKIDKARVLPDFFDGYTFVIDDRVEDAGFDKELLNRYVKAYGGVVMDTSAVDSDSDISFVLSAGAGYSKNGLRVRADWLWRCHEEKRLADVEDYKL
ncbi:DNA repair protein XRCC1 isoform X2 [Cydia pomonella]|uniref:DNA repair protein XRCC1 isoform X2 n=1 Tax=Cydia pomonella TaxID=82600 RepID=UPI002ADDC56F|nr:DNA repair protein XRCC1 isoform X2 [Cydia pomonella]